MAGFDPPATVLNESEVGVTCRIADIVTVTWAVPVAVPEVAVMVAVPSPLAVTKPEDDAIATPAFEEDHATEALAMFAPF